jgi:hypothetical protein
MQQHDDALPEELDPHHTALIAQVARAFGRRAEPLPLEQVQNQAIANVFERLQRVEQAGVVGSQLASRSPEAGSTSHKERQPPLQPPFRSTRRTGTNRFAQVAAVVFAVVLVGSLLLVLHMAQAARTGTRPNQTTRTGVQPAPRVSPSEASPAPCQTQQLLLAFDEGGVAVGNAGAQFVFANQSKGSCTLVGYPALQLLDARHQPIRAQVGQATVAYLYSTHAPHRFVLQAGEKAYFVVEWSNLGCATPSAFLRVTPPDNQTPLLIAFRFCAYEEYVEISPLEPDKVLGVFV